MQIALVQMSNISAKATALLTAKRKFALKSSLPKTKEQVWRPWQSVLFFPVKQKVGVTPVSSWFDCLFAPGQANVATQQLCKADEIAFN